MFDPHPIDAPPVRAMRSLVCLLCLLLGGFADTGVARDLHGRVYLDIDRDGQRDRGEPGVPDVQLSNGRGFARTDAKGRYRIELRDGDTLFLVKPSAYALPIGADGLPVFWQHERQKASAQLRYGGRARSRATGEFALWMRDEGDPVEAPRSLLVFGDPQPKNANEVGHFDADIVMPIVGRHAAAFGLSLGDIVDDDLALYPAMKQSMRRLRTPWLHVPGNHDVDYDAAGDEDSLETYRAAFGPDNWAWEEPGLAVVGLDNVIYLPGQKPAYTGGLREEQFVWLQRYLDGLADDTLVVLAMHIHLFDAEPGVHDFRRADRARLFAMLERFPHRLLLTAHEHTQRQVWYGPEDGWHGSGLLHEYNVGATCGGYWSGFVDDSGLPDATMSDGTPNGYATLDWFDDGRYALRWHVARDADDAPMRLHAPKVLRRGAWPGAGLYANVFMADAESRVELRIDGGAWQPMQRLVDKDPWVRGQNLADDAATSLRGFNRMPEAEDSTHLWWLALPTDLDPGEHVVEVRAQDRWRGWLQASTRYTLVDGP